MEDPIKRPEKIKLTEINPYLTCYLCKGYLIDATTISECLHSFCRSCIIKFLQDNSYCPVCEVIINKAKPNLKLDKTLQDIVYKLVPELFLREMSRRKQFYQQYPQIAVRVSPEERGEDTERTIFNPQDCISLSMEYVSADSSPGAIKLLGFKNDSDKSDQFLSPEENQALMKRYLQCPGMCRVDVLKKFVINKYNVDTSLFHIDILYKRVPLPDHYTLIDIAYIYSWKRNEPMKFYFRITDLNKVSERFDYFDSANHNDLIVQLPLRTPRHSGSANRRKEHVNKKKKQEVKNDCDKAKVAVIDKDKTRVHNGVSDSSETLVKTECDNNVKEKVVEQKLNSNKENLKVKVEEKPLDDSDTSELSPKRFILKIKKDPEKSTKNEENSSSFKVSVTSTVDSKDNKTSVTYSSVVKPEVSGHLKNNVQNQQSDVKNSVYTNITLNRTNNLEIITKIQKVSNKDGKPIEVNIIEQTVKANETTRKQKKKSQSLLKLKPTYLNKINKGSVTYTSTMINSDTKNKTIDDKVKNKRSLLNNSVKIKSETIQPNTSLLTVDNKVKPSTSLPTEYDEKLKFLENFNLTSKDLVPKKQIKIEPKLSPNKDVNKRKPHSPAKSSSPKRAKLDKKPITRIILQSKPKPSDKSQTPGLQSLIENCKIPSSLSITIKDSTESNKTANTIPPVKNFIEILKLPDENKPVDSKENTTKLSFSLRMNDDSEQKVDEDLAEIAKSLTEKIPMSTTISQIVGPKTDFPIPVKTNVPPKFNVQSPVPDLANKLLNVPTDSKPNSRTPQSFQKIFEESIKKPDGSVDTEKEVPIPSESSNEVTSTSNNKRNLMEIASQLYKKTKLELEKTHPLIDSTTPKAAPKVAIPRLPHQRSLLKISKKLIKNNSLIERADGVKSQQTLTNMHSNALGLNYTISVGPNVAPKTNGLILKKEGEVKGVNKSVKSVETKPSTFTPSKDNPGSTPRPNSIPRNISPSYNSPRNSPKHSPKSSPMVKHMYAPTANLKMDQLRVNTYSPKLPSPNMNNLSKISPNLPSSSTCSKSPNTSIVSPKPVTPSSVSPKPSTVSPGSTSGVTSALSVNTAQVKVPSKNSPKPSSSNQTSPLSPNQILERYNIQNLAQLTASLNFNAANFGVTQGNQLAAFQQVMLLKHFEMQNRQNWLNLNNQGSLLQYEKYLQNLQNLKTAQNQVLGNIKEN